MQSQWLLYRMTKNCKGLMIDFSFAPSPFRSVGTQKEKPSQTVAVVFDGFLCSMPYGLYSKLSVLWNVRYNRIIQRCKGTHIIWTTKYFSRFFLRLLWHTIFIGYKKYFCFEFCLSKTLSKIQAKCKAKHKANFKQKQLIEFQKSRKLFMLYP